MKNGITPKISVVLPCLNEEKTIGTVIRRILEAFRLYDYQGEVIVADNGSTDHSQEIAADLGAKVVPAPFRGYGNALLVGIAAACGQYIVMGDADDTYDFMEINRFIEALHSGADFVMGTRLKGTIENGAMPVLHRYLGTPVLTFCINKLFNTSISDCNCGFRGFKKEVFAVMDLQSTGMEFASEMVIKAGLLNLSIREVPVSLRLDNRGRIPHLRTWSDGWRHLRFILAHGADKIMFAPGVILTLIGIFGFICLLGGPVRFAEYFIDFHFLFPSALAVIFGTQLILFSFLLRAYTGLSKYKQAASSIRKRFTVEGTLIAGTILMLIGLAINIWIVVDWLSHLGKGLFAVRTALLALTLMDVGAQTFLISFFIGVLKIPNQGNNIHI